MAMWRKWGRECRDRGNKRQERSKWEAGVRVREGGVGQTFPFIVDWAYMAVAR